MEALATEMLERPARRRGWIAFFLLLAALCAPGLLQLETNNSPEAFFVRGSKAVDRYQEFQQTFGSDHALRILVEGSGLWTREGFRRLADFEEKLVEVHGIARVVGLRLPHSRGAWPPEDPEIFRKSALDDVLYRSLGLIDRDGSRVAILVMLESRSPRATDETLGELEDLLPTLGPRIEAWLVGMPVLNRALDRSSREIETRFFPLLLLFTVGLLALTLRDLRGLFVLLAFVGLCELVTLATMGASRVELNLVLAVLPPLLYVITLATGLHLLLYFRRRRSAGEGPVRACVETYRNKGWSVLWTGLSTLVGFLSLSASPVEPVRVLGLWTGFGLLVMLVVAFTALPVLLVHWAGPAPPTTRRGRGAQSSELGYRWGRWACHHRRGVLLGAFLFAVLALAGLSRLQVESNALRYLPEDHLVRQDIEALQAAGIGAASIEVVVEASGGELAPEEPGRLSDLGDRLAAADPRILGVFSLGTVVRGLSPGLELVPFLAPAARDAMVVQALRQSSEASELLSALVSPDRRSARVSVSVPIVGQAELAELERTILDEARRSFPDRQISITGQLPLLLEAQGYLIRTLGLSLGLTLLAVTLILRWLLPGFRLTVLSLLPNLWPVLGVLGVMGWVGIPLDIATVMVASIALGLAVDDTLHTLGHFRRLGARRGAKEGMARTLEITAPAYVLTGIVLVAGFGVCGFSDFAPTARFGLLTALAVSLAVVGDLLLLPALLSLTPRSTLARWRLAQRAR